MLVYGQSIYCKNQDVVLRRVGELYLLIPSKKIDGLPGNSFFYTNHLGAYIWENYLEHDDKLKTFTELIDDIIKSFECDNVETVKKDIDEFLMSLEYLKFISLLDSCHADLGLEGRDKSKGVWY